MNDIADSTSQEQFDCIHAKVDLGAVRCKLTPREWSIIQMLQEGCPVNDIREQLAIPKHRYYRSRKRIARAMVEAGIKPWYPTPVWTQADSDWCDAARARDKERATAVDRMFRWWPGSAVTG